MAALQAQVPRRGVEAVAHFPRQILDAAARVLTHGRAVAQGPRHGDDGHLRPFRQVGHGQARNVTGDGVRHHGRGRRAAGLGGARAHQWVRNEEGRREEGTSP
ncbi:hypothetical protein AZA_58632 [Nitrospirillum viridazoti Y2]|nr:hypothetical protein AZA_58632 [Nitrospirillum amazonense Y2]